MDEEPLIVHAPGCTLESVHFLRHTAAAIGMLTHENPEHGVDRVSVEALADTLARFAEQDDWASVTLKDLADHATLMNTPENRERFSHMCTCGALG
jgi:hypothetical protein